MANLGLGLLEPGATRQNHVVAVLVELDDLGLDLLADVGLEVTNTTHLDQGGRQEATQTDVDDQAALDDLDDGAGDDTLLVLDLLNAAPGTLVLSTLLGEDEAAFLVLFLLDQGLDLVTDLDDIEWIDVMLDRQLLGGDDALGLVTDVEEDLVAVDLDDGSGDDVTVVEVLDGGVDRSHEGFGAAQVVNGDRAVLGGGGGSLLVVVDRIRGGGLSGGGHVVGLRLVAWMCGATPWAMLENMKPSALPSVRERTAMTFGHFTALRGRGSTWSVVARAPLVPAIFTPAQGPPHRPRTLPFGASSQDPQPIPRHEWVPIRRIQMLAETTVE